MRQAAASLSATLLVRDRAPSQFDRIMISRAQGRGNGPKLAAGTAAGPSGDARHRKRGRKTQLHGADGRATFWPLWPLLPPPPPCCRRLRGGCAMARFSPRGPPMYTEEYRLRGILSPRVGRPLSNAALKASPPSSPRSNAERVLVSPRLPDLDGRKVRGAQWPGVCPAVKEHCTPRCRRRF